MKKWKEITIGDEMFYTKINILDIDNNLKIDEDLTLGRLKTDKVIDKYNLFEIELEDFGVIEFSENDLEKNSDTLECQDDAYSLLIIATSQEGIIAEIKNILTGNF